MPIFYSNRTGPDKKQTKPEGCLFCTHFFVID